MGAIGKKAQRKPKSMDVIPESGKEADEEGGIDKYLVDDEDSDDSEDVFEDADQEEMR